MGEGPDSMNFKSPISLENRVTVTNPMDFFQGNVPNEESAKNYPPNVPKKTSNSVYCKHTSRNRTNRPISGPGPAGNCTNHQLEIVPMGAFLQPDAFFLPLVPSFFVQIQLASPVRISHLKGGTVGSDFSWRSWTHCHLLWPLTGSLTADICKIHIHVYIYNTNIYIYICW